MRSSLLSKIWIFRITRLRISKTIRKKDFGEFLLCDVSCFGNETNSVDTALIFSSSNAFYTAWKNSCFSKGMKGFVMYYAVQSCTWLLGDDSIRSVGQAKESTHVYRGALHIRGVQSTLSMNLVTFLFFQILFDLRLGMVHRN